MICRWCGAETADAARCPGCGHDPQTLARCACAPCTRGPVVVFAAPPAPPPPPPTVPRTVKGNAAEWRQRIRGLVPMRRGPGPS